jgi:hypothetical protein
MEQKPSDMTPEIPSRDEEGPDRYPAEERPGEANDEAADQDEEDTDPDPEIDDDGGMPGPDDEA